MPSGGLCDVRHWMEELVSHSEMNCYLVLHELMST